MNDASEGCVEGAPKEPRRIFFDVMRQLAQDPWDGSSQDEAWVRQFAKGREWAEIFEYANEMVMSNIETGGNKELAEILRPRLAEYANVSETHEFFRGYLEAHLLGSMVQVGVMLMVIAIKDGVSGSEEWIEKFLAGVFDGTVYLIRFMEDLLRLDEVRNRNSAKQLARETMNEIFSTAQEALDAGKIAELKFKRQLISAICIMEPHYYFDIIASIPEDRRDDVTSLPGYEAWDYAEACDVPPELWVYLLTSPDVEEYRTRARELTPLLSSAELAKVAHKGDAETRRWAVGQIAKLGQQMGNGMTR